MSNVTNFDRTGNRVRGPAAMLLVDCEQPKSRDSLSGWLGAQNIEAVWGLRRRYIAVLTVDVGGDPRYVHSIECISDIEGVLNFVDSASGILPGVCAIYGVTPLCGIDIRFLLNPRDLDWINEKLDVRAEQTLRNIPTLGSA